jgi:hypothetical protein
MSPDQGAHRAEQRAHAAALLSRYPDLTDAELKELHAWFAKGATALDLGLLASEPDIAEPYRAYRAEHYDRIKPADLGRAALFIAGAVGVIGGIALLMP